MQKENSVIKNYIYSSEKCILKDEDAFSKTVTIETSRYRELSMQSMAYFYLFLLRREQMYRQRKTYEGHCIQVTS